MKKLKLHIQPFKGNRSIDRNKKPFRIAFYFTYKIIYDTRNFTDDSLLFKLVALFEETKSDKSSKDHRTVIVSKRIIG